ncbi:hypothetical protein P175DRAFT_0553863 [Aspergillus ochraceoroseus IBT 24754]|uniref:C3H1-type domain-containing protein n=1 Tax=Aspergillus ochraceoroseus IBT 24754 TaxID=1392256 RepID=A0A2T5M7R5_9EURO|nr:uncharacterized protein P175DRAFT_0553863 [Aspergillus ochraceoroseus IBT 24754]PTU24575.1 hypothetical protein P175DRAFT_0553863 [Aspergillus ochraceoroseus IBT 24754]
MTRTCSRIADTIEINLVTSNRDRRSLAQMIATQLLIIVSHRIAPHRTAPHRATDYQVLTGNRSEPSFLRRWLAYSQLSASVHSGKNSKGSSLICDVWLRGSCSHTKCPASHTVENNTTTIAQLLGWTFQMPRPVVGMKSITGKVDTESRPVRFELSF